MEERELWSVPENLHPYAGLAFTSIVYFVQMNQRVRLNRLPPALAEALAPLREELSQPGACFVSLKKFGNLRGCIGTIEPLTSSLGEEIAENAVSAATRDPRFPPVQPGELRELEVSVDVLSSPREAKYDELDPKKYGLIVEQGGRRGLLLPDLPDVRTVEFQVQVAAQKGGIDLEQPHNLYVFTVDRYR